MSEELRDQPLLEHINALRTALIHIICAALVLFIPAYAVSSKVIDFIIRTSCPESMRQLSYFSPMEAFMVEMKTALVLSLVVAFPYSLYQLWRFFAPALYAHERRSIKFYVGASTLLFVCGGAFCLFVIVPIVMNFSSSFATENLRPVIGLASFMNTVLWLVFAFGLMFQFPIIVFASVAMGLVEVSTLARKRSYVVVVLLIVSAVLTPPDVVSQLLLATPCYLLFELALLCAKLRKKKKTESVAENGETPAADSSCDSKKDSMLDFYENERNGND